MKTVLLKKSVAPLVGAWIEIMWRSGKAHSQLVAPLVGAWIEIKESLVLDFSDIVAPLVGAWIEIYQNKEERLWEDVAPLVGAWIEITLLHNGGYPSESLPSWERGLKSRVRTF